MKVKEVMIKNVESVSGELSVKEAMGILFKREISGLPVMDENGKLLGMFTEKGILSYLLPSYVQQVGRFIYEENPKATKKKLLELSNVKVKELMRKEVITINEETTLCEVARIMLTQRIRRLPVLDSAGKVVGLVARSDILKAMAKEVEAVSNI